MLLFNSPLSYMAIGLVIASLIAVLIASLLPSPGDGSDNEDHYIVDEHKLFTTIDNLIGRQWKLIFITTAFQHGIKSSVPIGTIIQVQDQGGLTSKVLFFPKEHPYEVLLQQLELGAVIQFWRCSPRLYLHRLNPSNYLDVKVE